MYLPVWLVNPILFQKKLDLYSYVHLMCLRELIEKKDSNVSEEVLKSKFPSFDLKYCLKKFEDKKIIEKKGESIVFTERGSAFVNDIFEKAVKLEQDICDKVSPHKIGILEETFSILKKKLEYLDFINIQNYFLERRQDAENYLAQNLKIPYSIIEEIRNISYKLDEEEKYYIFTRYLMNQLLIEIHRSEEVTRALKGAKGINILVDTNIILGSIIPEDIWYSMACGILLTIAEIMQSRDNLPSIKLWIFEETKEEFRRVIEGNKRSILEIHKKVIDLMSEEDKESLVDVLINLLEASPSRQYFLHFVPHGGLRGWKREIHGRYEKFKRQFKIEVYTKEKFEELKKKSEKVSHANYDDYKKFLESKGINRFLTQSRFNHDLNLYLLAKFLNKEGSGSPWMLWTFDQNLPFIEDFVNKDSMDKTLIFPGIWIASIIEPIAMNFLMRREDTSTFAMLMKYGHLFYYMQSRKRKLKDELKSALESLKEISEDSRWEEMTLVQAVSKFLNEYKRKIITTQPTRLSFEDEVIEQGSNGPSL